MTPSTIKQFALSLTTQGDTGSASRLHIEAQDADGVKVAENFQIRARVCNEDTFDDSTNATIAGALSTVTDEVLTADKDLVLSPAIGVNATETLTLTGVVIDGETITIHGRVYEFDTDGVTTGPVAIDISAHATASQGTLTVGTQPTVGDQMVVGSRAYTFVPEVAADAPGEIGIGADLAAAKVNIVAAINGTDGFNVVDPDVTAAAFVSDDCVITAKVPGTLGDAIVTTETFTAVGNVFDAATLGTTTAGVDATAALTDGEIISAVNGDTEAIVTAAQGAGTTVDITANSIGTWYNTVILADSMANGSWGAGTMSGGAESNPGEVDIDLTDASVESVTLRLGIAPQGSIPADYTDKLTVAHAAP